MQQGTHKQGESGYLKKEATTVSGEFTQVEVLAETDVTVIARGIRYGRWYLLKALRPEVAGQQMYLQMLVKEFKILMQMNHPGVVRAVDFRDVPSLGRCIIMEWIEGETLDEWLKDHTDRKSHRCMLDQLLDAVAHIHSRGIAHRDLKPQNVMIEENSGRVKVIDFGLADTAADATLKQPAGTLAYMSPEQQLLREADVRNDIYSLGVMLSEMNLGWLLRRVAARCLRPIDKRWQSVELMQRAIARIDQWRKWMWRVVGGIACLALLVGVVMIASRMTRQEQPVVPDSRIDSLQTRQTEQAAQAQEQQQRIDEMNQALSVTQASNVAIERQQQAAAQHQHRVAAVVSRGKTLVDQAMRATGIKEHLDTLSQPRYARPGFNYDLLAGKRAIDSYLEGLQGQFDAADLSAISQQLTSYWQTHWLDPLNKKLM